MPLPFWPKWTDAAACNELSLRESDRLFFNGDMADLYEGRRMCLEQCPVLETCRAEADLLESTSRHRIVGVIGGEFVRERLERRKTERQAS